MIDFIVGFNIDNSSDIKLFSKFDKGLDFNKNRIEGKTYTLEYFSQHSKCQNSIKVLIIGEAFISSEYFYEFEFGKGRLSENQIIKLYKKFGVKLTKYLKGVFALLVFDDENHKYYFINGKLGLYEMYYYVKGNKIIVSSSYYSLLKIIESYKIDYVSALQTLLFDFVLGDETIIKDIHSIPGGNILVVENQQADLVRYFNFDDWLTMPQLNWSETYKQSPIYFNNAMEALITDKNDFFSALTSGFDSRTVLSNLMTSGKRFTCYTWGNINNYEFDYPRQITMDNNIPYNQIILDDNFTNKFDYYANQAIFWSNGRATINRANHNFAYDCMHNTTNYFITGLLGSEIIRPISSVGTIMNNNFLKIILSENINESVTTLLNENREIIDKLFPTDFHQMTIEFRNRIEFFFNALKSHDNIAHQFYLYVLNFGLRKYFGHEINTNRIYGLIVTPYADDDFIKFLLRTPITLLNNSLGKKNPFNVKKGQRFYNPIIQTNQPVLLNYKTERGYAPKALNSYLFPLNVIWDYQKAKKENKKRRVFSTDSWNNTYIQYNEEVLLTDLLFKSISYDVLKNYPSLIHKVFSMKKWINMLNNNNLNSE